MLTLSVQQRYVLTHTYNTVLLYFKGCSHTLSAFQLLIRPITLITESFLSSEQITLTACWLPLTGIHRFQLAVGTSSGSAHMFTEPKKAKKPTKKDTSVAVIGKIPSSIHKRYLKTNSQNIMVANSTPC